MNPRRLIILGITAILILSCNMPAALPTITPIPSPTATLAGPLPPPTEDPFPSVIMDGDEVFGADSNWLFASGEVSGYWMPSEGDTRAFEVALAPYLIFNMPSLAERLVTEDYHAQYVGVIIQETPLIFGNYFCHIIPQVDWQQEFYIIADGGACFFNILYDPATGSFLRLQVNGES